MRPALAVGMLILQLMATSSCQSPYEGLTPEEALIKAARTGDAETVRSLILRKVDVAYVSPQVGNTALIEAARYGHEQIARELLANGAPVDQVNSAGITALMAAAMSGQLEPVRLLIAAGADVNSRGAMVPGDLGVRTGPTTALLMSITGCQTEAIQELLRNGASVQFHADQGRLAVASARERGCSELIPILEQARRRELGHEKISQ